MSNLITSKNGELWLESVPLQSLAERFQTPLFAYSRRSIETAYQEFEEVLAGAPHQICYAVKANGALALLQLLARLGAGFDIVSGGELALVLAAGGSAERTVFSGVGKRSDEIEYALTVGIQCFDVESTAELERISDIASRSKKTARVALRVNPDIEGMTHPHLTTGRREDKFGIPIELAEDLCRRASALPGLRLTGLACHIGSSLHDPAPYVAAGKRIIELADRLKKAGIALDHLDFGGGFPVGYRGETLPPVSEFLQPLKNEVARRGLTLFIEPGRSIVGPAGILLTRVEYIKHGEGVNWLIADAGMTELMRPPLYGAWHDIRVVKPHANLTAESCHVVGPVCESADFLGRDRMLAAQAGDVLAVMDAGAYGASMASNYNARPRPAEVLVDGEQATLIRRRETYTDLMRLEQLDSAG
ncbi:MAG TPA: diaminopimelate decarboxylase [Gammaproteobacteria bacterium]|nr:diaminopimelate decarboxylase [Gammaproteobacteria bacterium]